MTVFLAQPSLESQVGYLRFRFSNFRFKLFVLGLAMLHQKDSVFFFHSFFFFFYTQFQISNCLVLLLSR